MLTGKHIRYGHAIAQSLRKLGHEIVLTTREHPDTANIMETLDERFTVVGKYDPTSLATRFKASLEREVAFYEMFGNNPPQVAISHGSIELCRTAFGLGKPIITTGDTTYAKANWLIIPLTDTLVISKAIPRRIYRKFGAKEIVQFDGVDEVAWVHPSKEKSTSEYGHPLIVVRQSEFKASYMKGEDITLGIAEKLTRIGNVIFLSRYKRKETKSLVTPTGYVDSLTLTAVADLVVGIGGTIAREAALQGTPSIVIPALGWSHVNDYISRKGFPLFKVEPVDAFKYAKKYLGERVDTNKMLAKLENPVDVIVRLVENQRLRLS